MNYKIFLINLDGASKRFDEIRRQLDFMGVHFERVSAVDGNLLSQDKIDCCYSKDKKCRPVKAYSPKIK